MARYMVTRVQTDWIEAECEAEAIEIIGEIGFGGTEDWSAERMEDSNNGE